MGTLDSAAGEAAQLRHLRLRESRRALKPHQ